MGEKKDEAPAAPPSAPEKDPIPDRLPARPLDLRIVRLEGRDSFKYEDVADK